MTFDGVDCITRRTLDFGRQQGQCFYATEGNVVYITEALMVFDEAAQAWGHFRGLAWIEANEAEDEGGDQRKRRRKK